MVEEGREVESDLGLGFLPGGDSTRAGSGIEGGWRKTGGLVRCCRRAGLGLAFPRCSRLGPLVSRGDGGSSRDS